MFNIAFELAMVFEPQQYSGAESKFLKQDIIIDIGQTSWLKDGNQNSDESKSSSILISLFGEKIRDCDFKIGDTGCIVGSHGPIGNSSQNRMEGIRFENPTYNVAYNLDGMKKLPEDYGKSSFEFVLSELYRIKLGEKKFDLVDFFRDMNMKLESAIGMDETCRYRITSFYKYLPKMILASAADVDLYSYLLKNGLDISILNHLNNEYENFSSNNVSSEIKFVESVHYGFIGLSQLEIEHIRIQRKHIFFSRHEMRWYDLAEPTHYVDSDFLATFYSGIVPDSIEVELSKRSGDNII